MKTVSELRAWPRLEGGAIELRWRLPPAEAFAGSQLAGLSVVRREHTFPRSETDGTVVYAASAPVDGVVDRGLQPLRTYYYTVFTREGTAGVPLSDEGSRVAAFATADFAGSRALYSLLPQVHRSLDRPLAGPELAAVDPVLGRTLAKLPPALRDMGQLERFLHVVGAPLDLMRSFAEGLGQLHDAREARPEFLRALARFVGWEHDSTLAVFQQRNEIAFAPRFYRRVGTVPSLREIVNRYTGWNAQVAESAESLLRANVPPQLNVFAVAERNGEWRGAHDASRALGIRTDANEVYGSPGLPAILVTPAVEPFALRSGMQLSVSVDDRLPAVMRLRSGDFAQIGAATAAELATALNGGLTEATATALANGRLELRSHTRGPDSRLSVDPYQTSLVTLEGAPEGRLAVIADPPDRVRLFYEARDPEAAWREDAARGALGSDAPAPLPARGEIRFKTLRNGEWSDSRAVGAGAAANCAAPAAARLAGGQILLVWVETAAGGATVLRYSLGTPGSRDAARLSGRRRGPFRIQVGSRLLFRGNWPRPEGFEFAQQDLPAPAAAAATVVAPVLNARLKRVRAVARADGTLAFETVVTGGDERLELDLEPSSAAAALGFDASNRAATGSWGDDIAWVAARDVAPATGARVADPYLVATGGSTAWLLWAEHAGTWQVRARRFDGTAWGAPTTVAASLLGDREPCGALDPTGRLWVVWSHHSGVAGPPPALAWSLRRCILTAAGSVLAGSDQPLTVPRPDGFDREPGVVAIGATLRVFYASDRGGGSDPWGLQIDPAPESATEPVQVSGGAPAERAPAPVLVGPEQALWLLYRSDRSVSASELARTPLRLSDDRVNYPAARATAPPPGPLTSVRLEETGTLRRFAGSTSVVPRDFARMAGRRRWDDLTAYTPQGVLDAGAVADDDLYTRGTVVLYLNRVVADSPLTQQTVQRLEAALAHFLPINVRVVVVLAPRVDIERFYPPGTDIDERSDDRFPFVESFAPGLTDSGTLVTLPDWTLLRAFAAGPPPTLHRSADPAQLTTLRGRTFQRILDPNRRWSDNEP